MGLSLSKWAALIAAGLPSAFAVQAPSAVAAIALGFGPMAMVAAASVASVPILARVLVQSLPKPLTEAMQEEVFSSRIVVLATAEEAMSMRDNRDETGKGAAWVKIPPAGTFLDKKLIGEIGIFAFSSFPSRWEAVKMSGLEGKIAIVIHPDYIKGRILYRTLDNVLYLPGGYEGPANILDFRGGTPAKGVLVT